VYALRDPQKYPVVTDPVTSFAPRICTDEAWSPFVLPLTLNKRLAELVGGNSICPMPVRVVAESRTVVAGDPRLT